MSGHKNQHYIPQCYLKAWCDPDCPEKHEPYIWIFEKDSKEGRNKAPHNVFAETDMYTILGSKGERILDIEHGLAGLESAFTGIRDNKIIKQLELDDVEKLILINFVAAMHARTVNQLDHMAGQWGQVLEKMEQMQHAIEAVPAEEGERLKRIYGGVNEGSRGGADIDQVRNAVENPAGAFLIPMVMAETKGLSICDMAILHTENVPGFITSDSPCVWCDPEAYKRPPIYRGPALCYESLEITLPVSSTECILINRQGIHGYRYADDKCVETLNKRTRVHALEDFVVNQNHIEDSWYELDDEPEDSWENQQKKKDKSINDT